jgi:short-subunit dehydrogenase
MKLARRSVAVITGAGSGIGRALAIGLAERGLALALADKDARSVEAAGEEAKKAGAHALSTHAVDVADVAAMTRFRDEALKAHGRVELLVNNAGVALQGELEELTLENMRWLMDINFWGVVHGTRLFLPSLRRQREAHIVNISSIFGIVGVAGQTAYAASKFAVRGFSEVLRHELGGTAIRVSTVHPGGVRTNIARSARMPAQLDPRLRERYVARFDEIARLTPAQAAARILRGIERDRLRIIVGTDARLLTTLQWLLPARYWMVVDRVLFPKEMRKTGPKPVERRARSR